MIQAWAAPNANGLDRVDLHYRVNYAVEQSVRMFDDGAGPDDEAGDDPQAARGPGLAHGRHRH